MRLISQGMGASPPLRFKMALYYILTTFSLMRLKFCSRTLAVSEEAESRDCSSVSMEQRRGWYHSATVCFALLQLTVHLICFRTDTVQRLHSIKYSILQEQLEYGE